MKSKICPILNIGRTDQSVKCRYEECKWWNEIVFKCELSMSAKEKEFSATVKADKSKFDMEKRKNELSKKQV